MFAHQSLLDFNSTSLDDPAFQPHSGYMFDEATEQDFRSLHHNMSMHME